MTLEDFAEEYFQEVLAEADSAGAFMEDVFFEKSCEPLMECGELDSADRVSYLGPPRRGIRVDGYGGDPLLDESDTLSLIIVDFNASARIQRLTRTRMEAIFRRPLRFVNKALDQRWRNALEETSPAFGLADLIATRWSRIARLRVLLITNRVLSDRVDGRSADNFDEKEVKFSVWDCKRLFRQATAGNAPEEICIDLESDFGGTLPILRAPQSNTRLESYLTIIPGSVLADIYDQWGARLLEHNVRVFLQARNKVNRGIRITIENDPAMFLAYNNGITATAEKVHTIKTQGRLQLKSLTNFQIVNGGQTTASIHVARRRKIDLSQVSVQMKLSVIEPDLASEMVPKISEYANSQNRVNAADFFSNHPFHSRVESFSRRTYAPAPDDSFRQSKWFYERARGQYADAYAGLTRAERKKFKLTSPRNQMFSKTDLAKFLSVWEGRPHEVSLGAQKNFAKFSARIGKEWEKSPNNFNESWYRESIAKAILFRTTERLVSKQSWYQGAYRANIVAYGIAKIAHYVSTEHRAVDFERIWRSQKTDQAMDQGIRVAVKAAHDILVQPDAGMRNVTEWAKKQACWSRVREVPVEWPPEFLDGLISIDQRKDIKKQGRKRPEDTQRCSSPNCGGSGRIGILAGGTCVGKPEATAYGNRHGSVECSVTKIWQATDS